MKRPFDPETATRRFSVGATYYANFTAIPRFVQMLNREAPEVDFCFVPAFAARYVSHLTGLAPARGISSTA
jgi:hypothetical protein